MISIEEIKERIGKNKDFNYTTDYQGLDMTGGSSFLENRQKNYGLLQKIFPELTDKMPFKDFLLYTHEGAVCWEDFESGLDFTGKTTEEIILEIFNIIENKKNVEVPRIISKQQRYEVLKRQKWKCNICHTTLKYNKDSGWQGEVAHIDHIHPYSKRDTYINGKFNINEDCNLQALCPNCNLKKNKREIN